MSDPERLADRDDELINRLIESDFWIVNGKRDLVALCRRVAHEIRHEQEIPTPSRERPEEIPH